MVLGEYAKPVFVPSPEMSEWAKSTFIAESGSLMNLDHKYLRTAQIGFLWTNVPNSRHQRSIVATAELGPPNPSKGGKWAVAKEEYQILQWFGGIPDFKITCYAPDFAKMPDIDLCATVEHELYHCHIQYRDGFPRYRKDGSLFWALRGHDVRRACRCSSQIRRWCRRGGDCGAGQSGASIT